MQLGKTVISHQTAGVMTLAIATAVPSDGTVVALEKDATIAEFGKALPFIGSLSHHSNRTLLHKMSV